MSETQSGRNATRHRQNRGLVPGLHEFFAVGIEDARRARGISSLDRVVDRFDQLPGGFVPLGRTPVQLARLRR